MNLNIAGANQLSDQLSDYDEDEAADFDELVDIGLINDDLSHQNEIEKLFLRSSALYPCKLGGIPQWLHLENLPDDLTCLHCKSNLTFLLQIYAPLETTEDTEGFHRYLFVFICKDEKCSNSERTIKVYRSQMSRKNNLYSFDAPPSKSNITDINDVKGYVQNFYSTVFTNNLFKFCNICGLPSNKKCAKCKFIFYCCEDHQKLDWSTFEHKKVCNQYALIENIDEKIKLFIDRELLSKDLSSCNITFPEYDISIEQEVVNEDIDFKIDQKRVDEQLELNKDLSEDLEALPEDDYDEDFLKFQKRISGCPKQVIRYDRGGPPLWVTKNGKINGDIIPKCEICGSARIFEFQIMPQLLNYLKINEDTSIHNTLDWAGLYVYTCENNCNRKAYTNEYIYKHDFA